MKAKLVTKEPLKEIIIKAPAFADCPKAVSKNPEPSPSHWKGVAKPCFKKSAAKYQKKIHLAAPQKCAFINANQTRMRTFSLVSSP